MKRKHNPARIFLRASWPAHRVFRAAVAVLCIGVATAAGQTAPVTQSELEAVYLFNFGKFVSWPAEQNAASAPFSICTLGSEDFRGALDSVTSNETLHGRKIRVRHLDSVTAAEGCHILFLAQSEETRLSKDLAVIRQKPVLTVSSLPGFLDDGGMIQFVVEQKRIRFAVNLDPAAQSHLAVSSELLKVAVSVRGKPAEEAR